MTLQPLLPAAATPAAGAGSDPTSAADGLATGTAFGAALAALVAAAAGPVPAGPPAPVPAPLPVPDGDSAGTPAEGEEACLPGGAELAVLAQLAGLGAPPAPPMAPSVPASEVPGGPVPGAATAGATAHLPVPTPAAVPGRPVDAAAPAPPSADPAGPAPATVDGARTEVAPTPPAASGPAAAPAPGAPAPAVEAAADTAAGAETAGAPSTTTPQPPAATGPATTPSVPGTDAPAPAPERSRTGTGERDPGRPAATSTVPAAYLDAQTGAAAKGDPGTGAGRDGGERRAPLAAPSASDAPPPAPPLPGTPGPATATATTPAAGTGAPTQGPPVAVPDQVLRHLVSVRALREGGHRTVLRLDPEHLGEVTLTVDVRAGSVRLAVSGGAEAVSAVQAGLAHLRSSLAESGLALGDVALRPDAGAPAVPQPPSTTGTGTDARDPGSRPFAAPDGSASGGPGRDRPASGGEGDRERRDHAPDRTVPTAAATPVVGRLRPGGLDVRV